MAETARSRRASSAAAAHAVDATAGRPAAEARRAAMRWQVVMWSGEVSSGERRAFDRWLSADPRHGAAWQQVQRAARAIRRLPGGLRLGLLPRP